MGDFIYKKRNKDIDQGLATPHLQNELIEMIKSEHKMMWRNKLKDVNLNQSIVQNLNPSSYSTVPQFVEACYPKKGFPRAAEIEKLQRVHSATNLYYYSAPEVKSPDYGQNG